jgi:LemA protein
MLKSVWFWLVAAVAVFWALGAYNRLVRLRADVLRQLLGLTQLWQQQAMSLREEIRQMASMQDTESQWAALDDGAAQWRSVVQSARQLEAAVMRVLAKPQQLLPIDDVSALRAAREVLETSWQRLADRHDDLAGEPVPDRLMSIWQRQHEQSETARLLYNHALRRYQQGINQFPALLIAGIFGFAPSAEL